MGGLEDREIVVLVLGLIVAGFALAHLKKLQRLPHWPVPLTAAALLLLGWSLSIFETWFAPRLLNVCEHVAYVLHSLLMLVWVSMSVKKSPSVAVGRSR